MSIEDALRRYAYQLTLQLKRRHLTFAVVNAANDNAGPEAA